jgi:putative aminopeptidase FrvX
MTDILPFLKSLISISGLSAYETQVANLIEAKWKPLVDETSRSRLGSLHGLKRGAGKSPRSSVLIAAHMDAIGLMVTQITDGFLHITEIGGIDPRVLPGTPVVVHANGGSKPEDLPGVIVMPPSDLLPEGEGNKTVALKYLLVDTGLSAREVSKRVNIGDLVAYNTEPVEMSGEIVSGHSLDNRASVAALTICLEELQSKSHIWDVWAVATTQEEVTYAGAATSAFQIKPSIAIVVDVTFGKAPGLNDWEAFALGKGPTLGVGANMHPFLHKRFADLAEKLEIPFAVEPMPALSSTDAETLQLAADGIPTMVVSIPLRYMHTPVEMVALKDIQRTGRLLAEFVASLQADFFEKIVWDLS